MTTSACAWCGKGFPRATPEAQPLLHPNLAELCRRKVAELHNALEHPTHAVEAVEKIRQDLSLGPWAAKGWVLHNSLSNSPSGPICSAGLSCRAAPQ
jgi:hypothetical protein